MANTANNNPIINARLSDNTIQSFYATTSVGGNRPTGFLGVYDYCKVDVTAAIIAECGVKFYKASNLLSKEQIDFLEKFFDIDMSEDEETTGRRMPKWVLIHREHGVVGYFKPNLGVTAETHTFKVGMEKEATAYVAKHFLKEATWQESGTRYSRYSEE